MMMAVSAVLLISCGISLRLDRTITDDGGHVAVVAAAIVVVGIRYL